MQDFGAPSKKPTWIYSNYSWAKDILKHKTWKPLTAKGKKAKRMAKAVVSINEDALGALYAYRCKYKKN